jgi:hypothetical protein
MTRPLAALLALVPAAALAQPPDMTEYLTVAHDGSGRFGLTVAAGPEAGKRLTFAADGDTNNTVASVNGFAFRLAAPTTPTAAGEDGGRKAWTTGWDVPVHKVGITQDVVLCRGDQTGKLDTVFVRYTLVNKAKAKQKVGLRFMLDTLIGGNDGVPFAVPERAELVTTTAVLSAKGKTLPEYVQAFERADFKTPGAVAHLGVRVSPHLGVVELPDSLVISYWPGSDAPWAYPITPLQRGGDGDSAVGLYWAERVMDPGEERKVGFTYGLAKVASGKSGGKIGLTAGGAPKAGSTVTLVAYLDKALKQPTVTVTLPDGLKLAGGQRARQTVTIRPTDPYGRATWRIACEQAGAHTVKVELADGTAEELTLNVR